VQDYYSRIRDHEEYYQPLEETTWPSIRIINVRVSHSHYNRLKTVLRNRLQVGEQVTTNVSQWLQINRYPQALIYEGK